jgi:hypothetical protein
MDAFNLSDFIVDADHGALGGAPPGRGPRAAPALPPGVLKRNDTSFPAKATAKLRELYGLYQAARADAAAGGHRWATSLKYYQYLVRTVMSDPEFGIGADGNARGLLVYHTMGMGKTRLAVAVAMALWDIRPPVVMLARGLQKNFRETVEEVVAALNPGLEPSALAAMQAEAVARFTFVSMDAYNAADQMARAGTGAKTVKRGDLGGATGGLDGKVLIVDEAHNFFRAIINSSAENANARRLYDMVMTARNLRLLFLTGTPGSKDPFELVPCFNMLAGRDLLPTQYETFYKLYVDRAGHRVRNRERLANRLVGLVSHVTHTRPSDPEGRGSAGEKELRDDGWFPEEKPTIIERVPMGPDQYRRYLLAREKEEAEGRGGEGAGGRAAGVLAAPPLSLPGSEKKAMSSYYVHSRALSTFAAPRDWIGKPIDAMPAEVFTAAVGPKLALIAERADKAPGPVLIYSQFVDAGGLKPEGRYLQRLGYAPYVPVLPPKKSRPARRAAPDAERLPGEELVREEEPALEEEPEAALEEEPEAARPGAKGGAPLRPRGDFVPPSAEDLAAARRMRADGELHYTDAEWAFVEELAPREIPAADPWYNPSQLIRAAYRSDKTTPLGPCHRPGTTQDLANLHHGQRKLFVAELQCLTHFLRSAAEPAVAVYAGAAPGHHIPFLLKLFPGVEWHLYDPAPFAVKPSARVRLYNEYFTDEVARGWRGRCDVFISDIRVPKPTGPSGWSSEFEAQVAADMAAQAVWTRLIAPRLGAMLKFRPAYVSVVDAREPFEYLGGRVLWQTWPPGGSTEGRLLVGAREAAPDAPPARYDPAHYQDAAAEHNLLRHWATYRPPAPGLTAVPGYDRCFDCTNEAAAWVAYEGVPGALRLPVAALMNRLTAVTKQQLVGVVKERGARSAGVKFHGLEPLLPAPRRLEHALAAWCAIPAAELTRATWSRRAAWSRPRRGGKGARALERYYAALEKETRAARAQRVRGGAEGVGAEPKGYYATISGEVPSEARDAIKVAVTSAANAHGAVIKAILVSKTGAEGLDLKFIRETHQVEPYWDKARDDQVKARAARIGSHDGLPRDEREVQPYLYVATANRAIWEQMLEKNREARTIDEVFHDRAYERYETNSAFRQLLAETCLECELFGYGNCRVCVPTGAPLFHDDPALDIRLPDPCEIRRETDVQAAPLRLGGDTYYYVVDPASPLGYTFFAYRADLGGFAPLDPADGVIADLLRALGETRGGRRAKPAGEPGPLRTGDEVAAFAQSIGWCDLEPSDCEGLL